MGNDVDPDDRVLLELDSRGRVSLGRLAGDNRRFLARVERDGVVILEPAVVMTTVEAALHANRRLSDQIERSLTDPTSRVTRDTRRRP